MSEKWILYFNGFKERERFVDALGKAWLSHFEVSSSLPVSIVHSTVSEL